MYVEHLSPGYWVTYLNVVEWEESYAAMDTEDHAALAEFVYGSSNHPLLAKEQRTQNPHLHVYPEASMPRDTLAIPGDSVSFTATAEAVLIAKCKYAIKLFELMDDPL